MNALIHQQAMSRLDLAMAAFRHDKDNAQEALDSALSMAGSFARFSHMAAFFLPHWYESPCADHMNALDADAGFAGRMFWRTASRWWSGCDGIDHFMAEELFSVFAEHWDPAHMEPEVAAATARATKRGRGHRLMRTIYRGQDRANEGGVSWTTDRATALFFAGGARFGRQEDPLVLIAEAHRGDIAMVINDRDEAEVVLFETRGPDHADQVVPPAEFAAMHSLRVIRPEGVAA